MRHYEIVFIIHPDQSNQASSMIERYKSMIISHGDKIHRIEDWGKRQLAYMIKKISKAHYICFNIECSQITLNEIEHSFRFNDTIIRYFIVRTKKSITSPSSIIKAMQNEGINK